MSRDQGEWERRRILRLVTEAAETSALTLRQYTESDYLATKTRVWKKSTALTTTQLVERYILQDLGARKLSVITRKELQAYLDRHAGELQLSASIVGHIRWQLRAIFEMAEADQLITKSPATGLVMPRCIEAPPKRTIGADDVPRAQLVLPLRERLVLRLAVCEGMRPGEITGLQLGDLRDRIFHISRRIYYREVDTPKTERGRRVIPATATTLALFEQWREFLPNQRADAWLFPSETGITPVWYTNILDRSIRPSLETIGLGDVNFLVLRRSWVTEFSQGGEGSRESRADRRPQRRRAPERISAAGPGDTTPGYAQVGKEATVNSLAGRRDRRSRTITSEALDGRAVLATPPGRLAVPVVQVKERQTSVNY